MKASYTLADMTSNERCAEQNGSMTSNWQHLTLGSLVKQGLATLQTGPFGSQLHASDYVEQGISVIPTEAIGRGRILDVPLPKVKSGKAAELKRHTLRCGDTPPRGNAAAVLEFLRTHRLPEARRSSAEEMEAQIQENRNSWD